MDSFLQWFISVDEGLFMFVALTLLGASLVVMWVGVFSFLKKNKGKKIKDTEW